jgi:hypothetical protein
MWSPLVSNRIIHIMKFLIYRGGVGLFFMISENTKRLFVILEIYLPTHRPIHLSTYLPTYLPISLSIYLSTYPPTHPSIYYPWLYSPLWILAAFSVFLILYTVGRTSWTEDQLVARPLPTQRTTQTE